MTITYWEDPSDYPSFREEREAALRDELEQAEKAIATLQAKVDNMTSLLEEILEWCRDNQDVVDGDDGQPQPDAIMKWANEIEEVLGRGGRYGF